MKKEVNIVLRSPIEELQGDLKAMLAEFGKTGKKIDKEMGTALANVEESLAKIATNKNTSRAVKQLQNLALTVRELGPEFEGMAQKIIQQAGGIKDSVGDIGAEIDYFASDTRKFDAVLGGVTGIAAGFEVAQGAMALFGDENEDLQKTMQSLMATMAVVNGLQEIQNMLQKNSAVMVGLNTGATKLYNAVVGQSVGAMKSFKLALAATGVGAAAVGLAFLVENWDKLKTAITGTTELQKQANKALTDAEIGLTGNIAELQSYKAIVNDVNQSEGVRLAALAKLNELGIETRDINIKNASSLAELNNRVTDNIRLIKEQARAEALKNIVTEQSEKLLRLEIEQRKNFYADVQAEAMKYNSVNKEIGNTLTASQALEKATNIIRLKNAKELSAAQNELNSITSMYDAQIRKLNESESKQAAITATVTAQTEAAAAAKKKQADAAKAHADELKKEKDRLAEFIAFNEHMAYLDKKAQTLNDKSTGSSLAASQGRKSKDDMANFNAQMAAKMASDSQIKLTGVVQSESEKQRSQFALTAKQYRNFQEQMETANESIQNSFRALVADTAVNFGVLVGELLTGEGGFQKFMNSFLNSISDFLMALGKSLIAAGVAMTAFYEFLTKNPVLAVAAGIAAVAASVVVRNVAEKGVAFAEGGIVSGPTLGLVGEYAGASTNPEVIAPLDKLKKMIQPSGETSSGYIAETRISGKDLALVLKRTKEGQTRG